MQENCRIKTSKVILNLVDVKCIKLIKINDDNASLTFPFKVKGRKIFMNEKTVTGRCKPGSFSDVINLQFIANIINVYFWNRTSINDKCQINHQTSLENSS